MGIIYFLTRIAGKYGGAFLGCLLVHKKKEVRNYLGLALIPQAGVAIGLAALGARTLGGETGESLETIILASSVLYELIGPACAKLSLYLSRSYDAENRASAKEALQEALYSKSSVEFLVERLEQIQADLKSENAGRKAKAKPSSASAADEQYASYILNNRKGLLNHR